MASRRRPVQARSRALVDAIVEGAARVVDREGLRATTNRIAAEAGVSIGSLYQYFPNKEALMVALAERHLDRAEAATAAAAQRETSATLEGYLRALATAIIDEHRDHPHMHQLIREHAPRDPGLLARFSALMGGLEVELSARLVQLEPPVHQPRRKARILLAALDGVIHHSLGEAGSSAEIVAEVVSLSLGYLERRGPEG